MIVMKFGGTSVSSKKNIEQINNILNSKKDTYLIVVSAFSGVTNLLQEITSKSLSQKTTVEIEKFRSIHFGFIKSIFPINKQTELLVYVQEKCNQLESLSNGIFTLQENSTKTQAKILSLGEQLSAFILYHYLTKNGNQLTLIDSRDIIITNGNYLNGEVDFELTSLNAKSKLNGQNYITGGFLASNSANETTTLGRGGSDYTAAIYANILNADLLEIWSDVNGLHNANPKLVDHTHSIEKMSYEEAFEMAYFGSKVLYPPSIIPVKNKGIPLNVRNTLDPEHPGTLIQHANKITVPKIQGVSSLKDIAIITFSGVELARKKGTARDIFELLEAQQINVILITQSCSEQSIGIGISQADLAIANDAFKKHYQNEIAKGLVNPLGIKKNQCIIALVGDNMKNAIGLSGKIFNIIGENGINITAIAQGASERNISIVIDQSHESKALNAIHEKFFQNTLKTIHVFIAGAGNVGKEFLSILFAQQQILMTEFRLKIKLIGIANSSIFLINQTEGLSKENALDLNQIGTKYDSFSEFTAIIEKENLRNSVFIDITASEKVSTYYAQLLKKSISIVTCNKIACSSAYNNYAQLLQNAKEYNAKFKYETTVGAALPIIKTIQDLLLSGDKIHKIEAAISGSLNYIFNNYAGDKHFSDNVKSALSEGYTEPDPAIDISGIDVMRKILILSREAGLKKELSDINFHSFLPDSYKPTKNTAAFFEYLLHEEKHFKNLYESATKNGNQLKVIATLAQGQINVGLQEIPPSSAFYNLKGKDNVLALTTQRYSNEPLVIKGAGAGANITASGLFADLLSIVNQSI